jgi:Rab-like protein 5
MHAHRARHSERSWPTLDCSESQGAREEGGVYSSCVTLSPYTTCGKDATFAQTERCDHHLRPNPKRGLGVRWQVCVVGPSQAGKTYLCRLLAETAQDENYYETTEGVRIQELDRKVGSERVNLQLWDCSGDPKYQACLPAMAKDCNALLLVYNCELEGQEQELEKWYQAMSSAGMGNLITSLVRIVAIKHSPGPPRGDYAMQGKMRKLHHTVVRDAPADGQRRTLGTRSRAWRYWGGKVVCL